ncbi:hypothetical protein HPB47_014043 [Ixodes persulcatus]|uniref:Uncharacterized protein n=1 Tax=Ixodes persulcatus TaxID=34615 RepID=A0AC60R274_IXOPE|nr:hypothetical protein HPB47_014043 [Ixodes persulcatus]
MLARNVAIRTSFCWSVESLVAEREESDPARLSSPDLGPPSSIGSSGGAGGSTGGVGSLNGSPGFCSVETRGWPRPGCKIDRTPVYEKQGPKRCIASPGGAPKAPNVPGAQLNRKDPLFPGYATRSQTWVGEPTWLGVRSDATDEAPTKVGAPCVRVWLPTWLGSVVTLLTKHLAHKVQVPPAGLTVRGDATLQTPAFTDRMASDDDSRVQPKSAVNSAEPKRPSDRGREREKRHRSRSKERRKRSRSREKRSRSRSREKKKDREKGRDKDRRKDRDRPKDKENKERSKDGEEDEEESGKVKKEPLSLEELMAKKKAEEEARSKPVFLTKEQREAEAIKRRQEEIQGQRQRQEEERKKRQQFFEQAKHSTGKSMWGSNDIPDRMLDRRAIREKRERERERERFREDEDEDDRDKVREHKDKEKEFEAIKVCLSTLPSDMGRL